MSNHKFDPGRYEPNTEELGALGDLIEAVRGDAPSEEQWQKARRNLAEQLEKRKQEGWIMNLLRNQGKAFVVARWAAAAALTLAVIALALGITPWKSPKDLAFAEVLEQIRAVKTLRFTSTAEGQGERITFQTEYMEPGKQRVTSEDGNVNIMDMVQNKALSLMPSQKKASRLDFSNVPNQKPQENFIESLQKMQDGTEETLGRGQIEGTLVYGFRVKQEGSEYTIWADMRTGLPVRVEITMATFGAMKFTLSDFEFNPPLDESRFSVEPPAEYELIPILMPSVDVSEPTENDLIAVLRMITQKSGRFPESLTFQDLAKLLGGKIGQGDPTPEEIQEFTTQFITLQRGLLFVQKNLGNDWHYEAQGIAPGAKDAVCWWRPQGAETYRVIYADLTAADVRPEEFMKEP
ncbi:MAG: outer membrane lipoprotein carrier protein LolA [bacterium]